MSNQLRTDLDDRVASGEVRSLTHSFSNTGSEAVEVAVSALEVWQHRLPSKSISGREIARLWPRGIRYAGDNGGRCRLGRRGIAGMPVHLVAVFAFAAKAPADGLELRT
ncbi:hypothetical protein AJ87_37540 [Rhizobium yanglingense]|nr:hypothetical protein AJ87_37540 [Rhizobium yanglingense]